MWFGLTGRNASGKTTVVDWLRQHGYKTTSCSDSIREWLRTRFNDQVADSTRIQYGGSVKPENAQQLLSQPNIDGALVGGAALSVESFVGIIKNA